MSAWSRLASFLRAAPTAAGKYLDARLAAIEDSVAGLSADGTFSMSSAAAFKVVYASAANTVALADADASGKKMPIGITVSAPTGATAVVRFVGLITGAGSFTAGAPQYASTTAGALTETPPTAPNATPIAIAINTTDLLVLGPLGAVFDTLRSVVANLGSDIIGYSDPSSKTTAATVATAIDELQVEAHSALGVIELPPSTWYLLTGAPLAVFANGTTTVPGYDFDSSKCACIRWNDNAAPAAITRSFKTPSDMNTAVDPVIHYRVAKVGATNNAGNTTTMATGLFNQVDAATITADTDFGGASSALTPNATTLTIQNLTRTISAADLAAYPASTTITAKPTAGTLDTDDLLFVDAYIVYTRKPRTS